MDIELKDFKDINLIQDVGVMPIFTIYKNPADYPHDYVARLWTIKEGKPEPTKYVVLRKRLQFLRLALPIHELGLTCFNRSENDDPKVVESWL